MAKDNEWYTPSRYVDAAREVMDGGIDLDPASCEAANQTVRATRYYSKADNGLMQPWTTVEGKPARVWLNPPYGRTRGGVSMSHQRAFVEKLRCEYCQGHVAQAVLLSLGNPNSLWFQPLFDFLLCFHRGHITFARPDGTTGSFGFPLAFAYLGPNEAKFIEVFAPFGRVARAVDAAAPEPMASELWHA